MAIANGGQRHLDEEDDESSNSDMAIEIDGAYVSNVNEQGGQHNKLCQSINNGKVGVSPSLSESALLLPPRGKLRYILLLLDVACCLIRSPILPKTVKTHAPTYPVSG